MKVHKKYAVAAALVFAAFYTAELVSLGSGAFSVDCLSVRAFPHAECESASDKIEIGSELGVGEDASFDVASTLIAKVVGTNEQGELDHVSVRTQRPLSGNGRDYLARESGSPVVVSAEIPAPGISKRNAVVIIPRESQVAELSVDTSAGASRKDAGDSIVVADRLFKLDLRANGYNGLAGESVNVSLAKRAVTAPETVGVGIAARYVERRENDQALGLAFDSSDLNNYEASGLACRADESAVGLAGSYAYDTAANPALVPSGISVTALAREETKRVLCKRDAEFVVAQQCEAEKEYSFQAACRVRPESRSATFLKRQSLIWQRSVCAASLSTQVRRKVRLTGYIEITVPNQKSFAGQITREVTFDETYGVVARNALAGGGYRDDSNPNLTWYNPFWSQDELLDAGATIETKAGRTISNSYNSIAYPVATSAAKITYVPRPVGSGGLTNRNSLLYVDNARPLAQPHSITNSRGTYNTFGCAKVINRTDSKYGEYSNGLVNKTEARYEDYVEYFKAFDVSIIGISTDELVAAGAPGGGGIVRVTNCVAYEVMEAVVQGDTMTGTWALVSGTPEAELITTAPVCPGPGCRYPQKTGAISSVSQCPISYNNPIGTETMIQYQTDELCYVDDPRDPPIEIKLAKARSKFPFSAPPEIPNLHDDSLVDLSEGGDLDRNIGPSDFSLDEYYGNWTRQGANIAQPTTEFYYPSGSSLSDRTLAQASTWCVPLGSDQDSYSISSLTSQTLVRAISRPQFQIATGKTVATPTGGITYSCPAGIRLDRFLSAVKRASCPAGSSSKLRVSKHSRRNEAMVWNTWSELGLQGENLAIPPNYSVKSEIIETRYDDLPQEILTARTHEVHPGVALDAASSFTGNSFPPDYGYRNTVDGVDQRKYAGWLRESDLKNRYGASVTVSSFSPFEASTSLARATAWCNADAYASVGGKMARGFGAKGIMRSLPKHVYGFNATKGAVSWPYVGIEISGSSATTGFYASQRIYDGVGAPQGTPNIHAGLTLEAFRASNYPMIGEVFQEACAGNEAYNEFTGYCHATSTAWKSSYRTVERVLHDRTSRAPWAIEATRHNLIDPSSRLNVPFAPATGGVSYPPGDSIDPVARPTDYLRLGLFRPLSNMSDGNVVDRAVLLSRPETMVIPVLGPGFATRKDGVICGQSFRMIALPVPDRTVPLTKGGNKISVEVDRNGVLPGVVDGGDFWGPMFIALDTFCDEGGNLQLQGTVMELRQDNSVHSVGNSSDFGRLLLSSSAPLHRIFASFEDSGHAEVFRMADISMSLVGGMGQTTGGETLEPIEVLTPLARNRSSEWNLIGRSQSGLSWQTRIKTSTTSPSSNQSTQPKTCSVSNLIDGIWSSGVSNGSTSLDCLDSSTSCALTEEELSLFTRTVANSKIITTTRPSATQFTPWSFELPAGSPHNPSYAHDNPFNSWTVVRNGSTGASVPSCEIYNLPASEPDRILSRAVWSATPKVQVGAFYEISVPGEARTIIRVAEDEHERKSASCLRWDSVSGKTCEVFHPTVGGPESAALIFGGEPDVNGVGGWNQVYVETKTRVAQSCSEFLLTSGVPGSTCSSGYRSEANSIAACTPGSPVYPLCAPCAGNPMALCAPLLSPHAESYTAACSPTSCELPMSVFTTQVEPAVSVSGNPGEDGTASGSATVFCRDCGTVNYQAVPGSGGTGSTPVSSTRSKTLSCMSWNQNPLNPQVTVRHLWSQPFVAGSSGQNGRPGDGSGNLNVYSDLTSEAIFMLSDPSFWRSMNQ